VAFIYDSTGTYQIAENDPACLADQRRPELTPSARSGTLRLAGAIPWFG
jgi:hypothetical protein